MISKIIRSEQKIKVNPEIVSEYTINELAEFILNCQQRIKELQDAMSSSTTTKTT